MNYHDQVLEGSKGNEAKCSICNQHVGMGHCPFKDLLPQKDIRSDDNLQ